jgi:hypothetical protein
VDPRLTPAAIRDALVAARNPDGGWPYYPGRASRLEPTVWALLALAREADKAVDIDRILRWPQLSGWLIDGPADAPVNYAFNAIAALACAGRREAEAFVRQIGTRLVTAKGLALTQNPVLRQDNSLQAWPWIDQTFSWVEPTAWCTLFLKKLRPLAIPGAAERIHVAEQMIRDRVCHNGGWNYGGSNVYGQELYPYVPTTAIALIAMQDHRDDPAVVKSVAYLQHNATTEPTSLALSLTAICFVVYGLSIDPIRHALGAGVEISRSRTNVLGLATSLYALSTSHHGMETFSVSS